jgi:putative transposase
MYTTDLTDSQWKIIKGNHDFKIWRRKRKYSIRSVINAIFYVNKTGIQWRMLPDDFPDWKLVYYYFRKWAQDGPVEKIHHSMLFQVRENSGKEASPSLGLIDSESVKSMSVSAFKGFDGNKKVNRRKRFIIVDTLGFIMGLVITTANVGERAELVMEKSGNRFSRLVKILADQGFDGVDFVAKMVSTFKIQWEVVVQVLGIKGFSVLPKRWIVERTFGWFAFHRRLTKDYEVNVAHAEAFIYWTMIRIMSRKTR